MNPRSLLLVFATASCSITDADLAATPALTSLTATASTDQLSTRKTTITGDLVLGYTADQLVQIRIFDGDHPVFASAVAADSLTIPIEATIDLRLPGINELTLEATYNGQVIAEKLLVTVPSALQMFQLTPAATAVNVFSANLSGKIQVGYTSDQVATLEIQVDGATLHQSSLDVSTALDLPFVVAVPLTREGQNEIVGTVSYQGETLTQRLTVDAAMTAPTITLSTFTTTFTPHVELRVTGNVTVVADPAYAIDAVEFSVDSGPFLPAAQQGTGLFRLDIVNPDLGLRDVAVRVITSTDHHQQTTITHNTMSVAPIFNCATPATSMLPDNDLIRDMRTETRTMIGYFGHPGHDISFVIRADVPGDGPYVVASRTANYGSLALSADFFVDRLRCPNAPCTLRYSLEAVVDGVSLCSNSNFGNIITF